MHARPHAPHTAATSLLLALLMAAACGTGEAGRAGGGGGGAVPEWSVEEAFRLGSVDDAEHALVQVGGARIGPNTWLYVSQPFDGQIRGYDQSGELRFRAGRRGEGPGEFGNIWGLGIAGDTLYVSDRGLHRLSFFTLEGTFLGSQQWASEMVSLLSPDPALAGLGIGSAFITSAPQVLLPDGSGLLAPAMAVVRGSAAQPGPQRSSSPRGLLRIRQGTAVADTVALIELVTTSNTAPVSGGTTLRFTCPFPSSPLMELRLDGRGGVVAERVPAASVAPAEYRVVGFGPSGDTAFVTAVPYQPVALDPERLGREVETIRSRELDRERPAPAASDVIAGLREIDCAPAAVPPLTRVVTTQDGGIWIRREEMGGGPVAWDVLGPDGALQGRLVLPAREIVAAASGDVLVTSWLDDLEVPYLTRYRLVR